MEREREQGAPGSGWGRGHRVLLGAGGGGATGVLPGAGGGGGRHSLPAPIGHPVARAGLACYRVSGRPVWPEPCERVWSQRGWGVGRWKEVRGPRWRRCFNPSEMRTFNLV